MMRNLVVLSVFSLAFLIGSCTTDEPVDQGQPKNPANAKKDAGESKQTAAEPVIHDAKCGCSIDGIGRCGNYIMIEGRYVPMIHPSLGKMEWCAQKDKGAKVETVGEMKDGKFVAESWKTVQ